MRPRCWFFAFGLLAVLGCSAQKSDVPVVGFVQYTATSSLDDCREGFVKGLASGGFKDGENVRLVLQNAHADVGNLNLMVQKFRDDGVTLVGTASTQSLQAASRAVRDIPIVFCGVIDPVAAGGAETIDKPRPNVTGVYNPFPVADGVRLVKQILPDVAVIGTLYDPGEPFSGPMQKEAQAACRELGIQWVGVSVSQSSDLVAGVQALKARGVQAMLQLPSNTVNQGLEAQLQEGHRQAMPMFSLQTDQVPKGVVAALGIDFVKAGQEAGEIAARILKGEKPSAIPLKKATVQGIGVNLEAARKFKIEVPAPVLEQAKEVVGR